MSGPPIRLIVFDMAGTIIDHGSVAPVAALMTAFNELGLPLSVEEARGPMGLEKRDHIAAVLRLTAVASRATAVFGHEPTAADVQTIYNRFLPVQAAEAQSRTEPIPGAVSCLEALRARSIAIGTTTGYPRSIGQPIADAARAGLDGGPFAFPGRCESRPAGPVDDLPFDGADGGLSGGRGGQSGRHGSRHRRGSQRGGLDGWRNGDGERGWADPR